MISKYKKTLTIFIWAALILIGTLVLLGSIDIYWDIVNKSSWKHTLVEASSLFLLVLLSLVGLNLYFKLSKTALREVVNNLEDMRDVERKVTQGISQHIQSQFIIWKFTAAESEIAYLLIKGFSTHEIAVLRGSVENTIREHATNIYRKANVKGRAQLASFFLEDLLPPMR